MNIYKNMTEAIEGAELFFSANFNYNDGVGIENQNGNFVEFYSKNDPAMDDTFVCEILA
jgi:hypothetical protein